MDMPLREMVRQAMARGFTELTYRDISTDEPRKRAGVVLQKFYFCFLPDLKLGKGHQRCVNASHYMDSFAIGIPLSREGCAKDELLAVLMTFCFAWATSLDPWGTMDQESLRENLGQQRSIAKAAEGADEDRQYVLQLIDGILAGGEEPAWA